MNIEPNATQGTAKGRNEDPMNNLDLVAAGAGGLLKKMANSTAEGFSSVRTKIERKLHEARSRLGDVRFAVLVNAKRCAGATGTYVRENPWKSMGMAAAAGLILGFFLKRR
ncbi:MAG: YqjD family protein [Burkholderiales bacterium]